MVTKISTMEQFAYLLPKLTTEERNALEESLREEGCRDPIVTWRGTIIDGHNRYSICQKHKIPFRIKTMDDLLNEDAVKTWIINNQLSRRNLTDEQRERFLGILHNTSKKGHGGARDNSGRKPKDQIEPLKDASKDESGDKPDTAETIAKQHGVSRETIKRAGKYATALDRIGQVSPAAEAKIMSGEAKSLINKSDIRNLADAPEVEVKKVAKAIENDKSVKKTTENEPSVQQAYKLINELENRADHLTDMVGKLAGQLTEKDRAGIANHIDNLSTKMQLILQGFL